MNYTQHFFWFLLEPIFILMARLSKKQDFIVKRVFGKKHKNSSRPKKSGARKKRRILEHKKRVLALGVPAEKVAQMNTKQLRDHLKSPQKTVAQYS